MSEVPPPHDHDQRFKTMLQHFLNDFFVLFFPEWSENLDAKHPEWITTEVFNDPPSGTRRYLDLLAKVTIKNPALMKDSPTGQTLALIHIEVESRDSSTAAVQQLHDHLHQLYMKYQLPVVPVALFLNVGKNGISIEEHTVTFGNLRQRFEYLCVGLPKLDAMHYLNQDNILGVGLTPFMNIPDNQIIHVGAEALLKIVQANITDQERFLLAECISAYLPLVDKDRKLFVETIGRPRYDGVKAMNLTMHDLGIIEGRKIGMQEGRQEGHFEVLLRLLTKKFGPLPERVMLDLRQKSTDQLLELSEKILTATTLSEMGLSH